MKKAIYLWLIVCLTVLICSGIVSAEEPDARTYVEILCSGNTKDLTEDYLHTEELLDALKSSGGLDGLQMSLKALGELQETGEPIISEIMGYTSYSVPCIFSVQKLNLVLNVDGEGKIAGIVTAPYAEGTNSQSEQKNERETMTEINLSIPADGQEGWELPGTLTLPDGEGPFPVVILVHGSGPSDRDETIGMNKPFRDLADGLAEKGIAVYRYEKRTYVYAQEMAADTDLTLADETILDAVKAAEVLAQQEEIDPERIFIAGHSLGGQALPAIDAELKDEIQAAGYIFLAAPARKLPELMREQYEFLYSLTPDLNEEQELQKAAAFAELDRLEQTDELPEDELILGAYPAYWKALEQYDQVAEAADITKPCLVLQGEEDYQVTMEDYEIWKNHYSKQENWQFRSYEGLTHLFMYGVMENGPSDYQKEQHVDERVITDIAEFISAVE